MLLASNRMPFRAINYNLGFVLFKHDNFSSPKLIVNCTPNHAITITNILTRRKVNPMIFLLALNENYRCSNVIFNQLKFLATIEQVCYLVTFS